MIWGSDRVAALAIGGLGGVDPRRTRASRSCVDGLATDCDASFVAVGHGACVVLETPDGETLLYDAGANRLARVCHAIDRVAICGTAASCGSTAS